jgi:hypothetical protein
MTDLENWHEETISYFLWKNKYSEYTTKEGTYNKKDKTIVVYFPDGEVPDDDMTGIEINRNNKSKNTSSNSNLSKEIQDLKVCINTNFARLFEILEDNDYEV